MLKFSLSALLIVEHQKETKIFKNTFEKRYSTIKNSSSLTLNSNNEILSKTISIKKEKKTLVNFTTKYLFYF